MHNALFVLKFCRFIHFARGNDSIRGSFLAAAVRDLPAGQLYPGG